MEMLKTVPPPFLSISCAAGHHVAALSARSRHRAHFHDLVKVSLAGEGCLGSHHARHDGKDVPEEDATEPDVKTPACLAVT